MTMPPHDNSSREKEAALNEFRLSMGLTIREVCEQTGLHQGRYANLNNGTVPPIVEGGPRQGQPKADAVKLAEFFGVGLDDLFPRYWCKFHELQLVPEQYDMLVASSEDLEQVESAELVKKALPSLKPREEQVLIARFFEDKTFDETAERFNASRERIRQIEAKALRKLKKHFRKEFPEMKQKGDIKRRQHAHYRHQRED